MADGELLDYGGRKYCRFHAPMEARDGNGVAKNDWNWNRIGAFNDEIIELLRKPKPDEVTDFTGVVFPADIAFSGTEESTKRVLGSISFSKATFSRDARFAGATFSDFATFVGATFSGDADFDGATFSLDAWFDGATFKKWATFAGRGTGGSAEFDLISFGPHRKQPCRFEGHADFSNRHFRNFANFREAVFVRAPVFHASELHQGTDFTGTQFLDLGGDAAPAYRTLKLAMAEMRARDEEGMFAALEHKCRRKRSDTSPFVKALSYVYGWTSDYGQFAGWPIVWLIGVAVVSFAMYLVGYSGMRSASPAERMSVMAETLHFTLRQVVDPFSAFQKTEGYAVARVFNDPPLGLALIASVQSLFSLAMIALFLLALRWRFRRD